MPRALPAGASKVFLSTDILSNKLSQKSALSVVVTPLFFDEHASFSSSYGLHPFSKLSITFLCDFGCALMPLHPLKWNACCEDVCLHQGWFSSETRVYRNPLPLGPCCNRKDGSWFFVKINIPSFNNFVASVPMETSRALPQTWSCSQVTVGYQGTSMMH